jgi:sensor domain CHASE-containing protein
MKYTEVNRLTNTIERLETYVTAAAREIASDNNDYAEWERLTSFVDNAKQDLLDLFIAKNDA